MTIDQAYKLVNYIANKEQNGNVTPDNFNLLAPQAQIELIMKSFGNPKTYQNGRPIPIIGYTMTTKTQDNLRTILKYDDNAGLGYPTSSNELDYPSDYLHIDSLERLDGTQIKPLLTSEIGNRRKSLVKAPTTEFPISAMYEDKIRIYPDLTDVVRVYVRYPITPVWAYTLSGTNPVYDAGNSVQFEMPADTHNEIVVLMLQNIGVNLSHNELTQYAQVKEQQGV